MRRREALVIGGIIAVAVAIPPILRRSSAEFVFQDLEAYPGFRRVAHQGGLSGADFFAGLDTPEGATARADLPDNLCTALFGPEGWSVDPLPIAVFSDYYCPYCASLERRLDDMRTAGLPVRLVFHELPLLGERSRWAAQVALAAKRQTDYHEIHFDLMRRGVRPGMTGLRDVSERFGLDIMRLESDARGAEVAAEIARTLALGRALGIPGTPGTFIGRTLFLGALSELEIERMVEMERAQPFKGCV